MSLTTSSLTWVPLQDVSVLLDMFSSLTEASLMTNTMTLPIKPPFMAQPSWMFCVLLDLRAEFPTKVQHFKFSVSDMHLHFVPGIFFMRQKMNVLSIMDRQMHVALLLFCYNESIFQDYILMLHQRTLYRWCKQQSCQCCFFCN